MNELRSYGVQIYQFPTEDEDVAEVNSAMNVSRRHMKNNVDFYINSYDATKVMIQVKPPNNGLVQSLQKLPPGGSNLLWQLVQV